MNIARFSYFPYFSIDNASVIYAKKVKIGKKMNMRGIH